MCLMLVQYKSDSKSRPRSKTAKEDIIVYKRLKWLYFGRKYASPFQNFYYPRGKVIKIKKFGIEFDWHFRKWVISEGLHAFKSKETAENYRYCNNDKLFKFVIPKGTKYYETANEIAALAMKRVN